MTENLRVAINESGAEVTCEPLPCLMGDESQLIQLIQNLISNAIKYHGPETPVVRISAEKQDDMWVFSVRDNGIGIEPQYFEKIFLMFQRLNNQRDISGSGVGLAICRKIAERHGGEIWLESEPGKGSIFYFSIPENGRESQ